MNACPYRDALSWLEAEAEIDRWCYAREKFWTSHGPERAYWRDEWRTLIRQERERLNAGRASLHAAYLRSVAQ